jgi:hypothetical protein
MKSVLISIDFIYREDGTLTPLELNTETRPDIGINDITNENFVEITSPFFQHEELHQYLQSNNITKIVVIQRLGSTRFINAFCNYYNYELTDITVSQDQLTVPEVEDSDDTLIIRIAYDTYALIDDLYARDNYEFHNLIKYESFASPVTFANNSLDTIIEFNESQDGTIPNYVVKARTPGYIKTEYPKLYRLKNDVGIQTLKGNLTENEFIQKFEYNSEMTLIDNRTHHLRSMNLICGENLEVINIINYKSINMISVNNSKLVKDYEIDENDRLHPLNECKYYPTYLTKHSFSYEFDDTDKVLMSNGDLKMFENLAIGDSVLGFKFPVPRTKYPVSDLDDFVLEPVDISYLDSKLGGIFVNITAYNSDFGRLSWFDGSSNLYLASGGTIEEGYVEYVSGGQLELGQLIVVFDRNTDNLIYFEVEDLYFDLKPISTYTITLGKIPEFLIQLSEENNLFLIQHNNCFAGFCSYFNYPSPGCGYQCSNCGKNSPGCVDCGGGATTYCPPP